MIIMCVCACCCLQDIRSISSKIAVEVIKVQHGSVHHPGSTVLQRPVRTLLQYPGSTALLTCWQYITATPRGRRRAALS